MKNGRLGALLRYIVHQRYQAGTGEKGYEGARLAFALATEIGNGETVMPPSKNTVIVVLNDT